MSLQRGLSNQKARYLFFGALNTVLSYGMYVVFLWLLDLVGARLDYILATTSSWLLSNITSFLLQKRYVFRAEGSLFLEFTRFTSVSLASFVSNVALGAFAVEILGLSGRGEKMVSQLMITGILVVVTFFAHRSFSFRSG